MSTPQAGLYIHLPWCERKCPYCDFNSYEARGAPAETRYVDALLRDLALELDAAGAPQLSSIFIGGGTPSLFSADAIARLLDGVRVRAAVAGDAEITLEANPGSAEAARFGAYRAAGVNRLSIGVQSFDDTRLAALGRVHDARAARGAVLSARAAGFTNFNLDLMFGLPGAARGDAVRDLAEAVACAPTHISWYQLTLEAGTAFAHKPPRLPSHDLICDDYDEGLELLAAHGYAQYEISAHARPGYRSRHNLNYWRFGDYLGIGAGAHGKITRADGIVRRHKTRHPERYMKALLGGEAGVSESRISEIDLVTEYMLNALRLRDGFSLTDFVARTGISVHAASLREPLDVALARGWLELSADVVRPSEAGYRFLNDLQLLFVAERAAPGMDPAAGPEPSSNRTLPT